MEQTNTNTILENENAAASSQVEPIQTEAPVSSISSLNDIHPIPEFQNGSNNRNKLIALGTVVLGILILAGTGFYYWKMNSAQKPVEETPVQEAPVSQTTAETTLPAEQTKPSELDTDPVIMKIDENINTTDSENITQTSSDLEDFDFENIDLELQQNPGL